MDLKVRRIEVHNFRAIRHLDHCLQQHNLVCGNCNHGKTCFLDALCICLGSREWTEQEETGDFYVAAADYHQGKVASSYSIVVTLSGFHSQDPNDYPEWFDKYQAKPFWWDSHQQCALPEKTDHSQELCCLVSYCAKASPYSTRRVLVGEGSPYEIDLSQPDVPDSFFQPLNLVYFPLLCLEWAKEFHEVREEIVERIEKWKSQQVERLKQVSQTMEATNAFLARAEQGSEIEDHTRLQEEMYQRIGEFMQAIQLIDQSCEDSEEAILKDLCRALPWFETPTKIDEEFLKSLESPSFEQTLDLLVQKSREAGAGRAFQPLVDVLRQSKSENQTCLVVFDEVEHFIPKQFVKEFTKQLLALSRQSILVSHNHQLIDQFAPNEVQEIANKNGYVSFEPIHELAGAFHE